MDTIVKERAIVKSNVISSLFRPPTIVNLPIATPEKPQAGQLENLPVLAKGILQIRLPNPPPVVHRPKPPKPLTPPKIFKSVVHQRREEVFD
jgi:hypothetical protein